MVASRFLVAFAACSGLSQAQCPYMQSDARDLPAHHPPVRRDDSTPTAARTDEFMAQFELSDNEGDYMTSDVGGPFEDQNSLKAGERGPTLLEDYIFRQKVRLPISIFQVRQ
jgi:catalase